jgi:xanthine dehydrogenase accessory factor
VRDLLDDLDRWRRDDLAVSLARVVDVEGSGPRAPGAAMAVNERGEVAGSVSGGCVEGAVVAEALEVLDDREPRVVSFGYSDDDAFAVGLTCGGTIHLFVEPLSTALYEELAEAIRAEDPVALATVIDGPGRGSKLLVRPEAEPLGSLGHPDLDRVVARDAQGELAAGITRVRHYGRRGEAREQAVEVFVESFAPPARMLVFGAVDFTGALSRVAKVLGYRVTVCDARPVFATSTRFPHADEVVVDWPDRLLARVGDSLTARDAVCVLTHDAKFDVPALVAALDTEAGYIGAMGSRRTHADRLRRLQEAGVDADGLARIRAPIGLDLGARTPEETAVSICAEIIAIRTGRGDVRPLSHTSGPIHSNLAPFAVS